MSLLASSPWVNHRSESLVSVSFTIPRDGLDNGRNFHGSSSFAQDAASLILPALWDHFHVPAMIGATPPRLLMNRQTESAEDGSRRTDPLQAAMTAARQSLVPEGVNPPAGIAAVCAGGMFLFGAFILACGTTHLMEAIIFWYPVYRLAGVIGNGPGALPLPLAR